MLVEAARQLDPRMFRQVTVALRQCLDPDGISCKGTSDWPPRPGRGSTVGERYA
jgi:hypothetical protein